MSIDSEMSPGIVMPPPTDLSGHWVKVARERIRSQENALRSRDYLLGYRQISSRMTQNLISGTKFVPN